MTQHHEDSFNDAGTFMAADKVGLAVDCG